MSIYRNFVFYEYVFEKIEILTKKNCFEFSLLSNFILKEIIVNN